MSYSLTKVSGETITTIRDNWFAQLEGLQDDCAYLNSSVERLIDWFEKSLETTDPICLWAVCGQDNVPRAVVEITDATKAKDPSLKFLSIYVEPGLILDCKDVVTKSDLLDIIKVIGFAIGESFRMTIDNGVKKLKIYGRTDEMRNVFDSLVATIDTTDLGAQIYRQGKWLIIESDG